MGLGVLEVALDGLLEFRLRRDHDVVRDMGVGVDRGAAAGQPRLDRGHVLQRVCDLVGHEEYELLQIFIGGVELHLIVVKDELHLEHGQVAAIALIKKVDPPLNGTYKKVF